jgi:hypothetical protein
MVKVIDTLFTDTSLSSGKQAASVKLELHSILDNDLPANY